MAALSVGAADIEVIAQVTAIPPEQTRALEFGTVPQQDTTVLLEICARIQAETLGGSSEFLKIVLNGREVKAARSRHAVRLVNKALTSRVTPTQSGAWFTENRGWRLLYAPDFEAARKVSFYEGDPYTTVLDVTDLVNPAGENRLTLANLVSRASPYLKPSEGDMIVQRLTIRSRPGASPMMLPAANVEPTINRGQPAAGPASYRGQLAPGGGFVLTVAERRWEFASAFSYPDAGLNRLPPTAAAPAGCQAGWSVRVQPRDEGGEVFAAGPDYRLERTVRFTPRRTEIADRLTNLHGDAPLGLAVRHEASLAGAPLPSVRLAGNPDPAVNDYYSPPNPSVHIALPDQGIGLLCEDDVFRNQARLFCTETPPAAGLRTEMLRLGPGETYTLRWSVYPVAGPDYFDFVNLVRQDWGANRTVDGAWTVFDADRILSQPVEPLRAQFTRLGIRYAISNGAWVDRQHDPRRVAFGTGGLEDYWADFRRRLRLAAARLREAVPQIRILVYYDSQRDTSEGGRERFRDSWLTDSDGNPLTTDWDGRANLTYSTVPTLENSYGRAMLAAVDRYLSETDSDGLYWDEMEGVCYGVPPITYNQFDGHSCLLDPTRYTIAREVGLTTLLAERQLLTVIDRLRRQGRPVMGNGPPFTRALLASGVPRMVETQHNDYWCYEGNLGSPLGYIDGATDASGTVRALRLACLPHGTPLGADHDMSRYLFPFTPIELHYGYLLGQERIITLHDGDYGWPGERCLVQAYHFGRSGKLVETDFPTRIGVEARTAVALATDEAAVLVRLPLRFEPTPGAPDPEPAWSADVRQVRYAAAAVSLDLRAPQGGVLAVADGEFALRDGMLVTVRLGQESSSATVAERAVRISVPAAFSGEVRITPR